MERSLQEKQMMEQIVKGPQDKLPFPLKKHAVKYNDEEVVVDWYYVIQPLKKQEVFDSYDLWPFADKPKLEKVLFDIHASKYFYLVDFKVIRWHEINILVSPYYFKSGGTVLDMVDPKTMQGGVSVMSLK